MEHFRATGRGWQTRISEVLLRAIGGGGDKLVYVKNHKKLYAKKFSVNKSKASKPKAAKRRPKRKGAHPGRGR